jgi:prevent-host-death family protein
MNTRKDIRPVTFLKARTAELLEQINVDRRPVVITQNGEARAVMLDPESYDSLRRAGGLLKLLAQGEVDVRAGHTKPQVQVFDDLDSELESKKSG